MMQGNGMMAEAGALDAFEDDYRQPAPFAPPPAAAFSGFSNAADEHVNECIARIETLKLKILGDLRLGEYERMEFMGELDTLRAAYLHLCTLNAATARPQGAGRDAPPPPDRTGLELEGVLGRNPRILENLDRIARVAPSKMTMLLEGETGSGKELFARIIHLNSKRKIFVPVNCGALPSGVIESELFGHVKGAFTGATADRKGRFEEAHGGTIFLDEIGELEPLAQVKLLRTLDVGEIQRVGSDKVQKVDVRVIAATNRNLEKMVAEGKFREDLFYRLNICHLVIPPLRERRDEIGLLLDFFIEGHRASGNLPAPDIDPELRRFLLDSYHYPGNIRELRNLAQYIAHISHGRTVRLVDLPDRYAEAYHRARAETNAPIPSEGSHRQARERAERDTLVEVFTRHRGNVKAVCRELDLSRARIYQLLKKHGLDPAGFRGV